MLLELDVDDDKRISKHEWMTGGLSTVPLLVLLGVETVRRRDISSITKLIRVLFT